MGWKVFREIARPFERAAHGVGLSGGGVTRSILRQGSRSARDVIRFSGKAYKNIGAGAVSFVTLGAVQPRWSGTRTASRIGQAAGIATAAYVGGSYLSTLIAPSANAPLAVAAQAAPVSAGVPLASAAPFAVETGISTTSLLAPTVATPLASSMTAASAAGISAASSVPAIAAASNAPAVLGVSAPEAAAITGQGAWVEPAIADKGFLTILGEKAVTTAVMGTTSAYVSSLFRPNVPAGGSAPGGAASEVMPLLAGGGEAGGTADDILNRFKGGPKGSPLVTVAIAATVLLLTYAIFAKRRSG